MLNGSVFAGCVHRLEDEKDRPVILGIEHVLQFAEYLHSDLQCFLRARLVFGFEPQSIAWIDFFEFEFLSVCDPEWFREFACSFDDFLGLHNCDSPPDGYRDSGSVTLQSFSSIMRAIFQESFSCLLKTNTAWKWASTDMRLSTRVLLVSSLSISIAQMPWTTISDDEIVPSTLN